MPDNVKCVVNAAQDELLLRLLHLPNEAVNVIRYNADKSSKTILEYISSLVLHSISSSL